MKSFSPAMKHTARLFLTNGQGGPLAQMTLHPGLPSECKTLGTIVAHAISVFSCRENLPILLPFINMMNNPAALAVSINAHVLFSFCLVLLYNWTSM